MIPRLMSTLPSISIYTNKELQLNWEEMKVYFSSIIKVETIFNFFQDSMIEMNLVLTDEEEITLFQHANTLLTQKKNFIHSIVDNLFQIYYHILDQCIRSSYFVIQQENQALLSDLNESLSRGYELFEGYHRELSEIFDNCSYAHGILVKVFSKIDLEVKMRTCPISFSSVFLLFHSFIHSFIQLFTYSTESLSSFMFSNQS